MSTKENELERSEVVVREWEVSQGIYGEFIGIANIESLLHFWDKPSCLLCKIIFICPLDQFAKIVASVFMREIHPWVWFLVMSLSVLDKTDKGEYGFIN